MVILRPKTGSIITGTVVRQTFEDGLFVQFCSPSIVCLIRKSSLMEPQFFDKKVNKWFWNADESVEGPEARMYYDVGQ